MNANPIYRVIATLVCVAVFVGFAMLMLPVVGAIVIGVIALMGLLSLSGWIARLLKGNQERNTDEEVDTTRNCDKMYQSRALPKKWSKEKAVDAEVIVEEKKD